MMTNFSQSLLSSFNAGMEYNATDNIMEYNESQNDAGFPNNSSYVPEYNLGIFLSNTLTLLICFPGFWGNGLVIWLLGFRTKRNPFTTYILNLAIADFGVLTAEAFINIHRILHWLLHISFPFYLILLYYSIFLFTFSTSQMLLTVISIDRCVLLFFPLWHQCHRPPQLSTVVCSIIWILTFLISATDFIFFFTIYYYEFWYYQFFLNTVVFMPIMCVSTIAMLVKVCLRSPHQKWGKLLRVIWLTLVFFLFFAFPMNAIQGLSLFLEHHLHLYVYAYICASLNSAINPMIYFLVGRDKRGRSSKRIKEVLGKLFKEEEDCAKGQETLPETQL